MRMYVYAEPRLRQIVQERGCSVLDAQRFDVPGHDSLFLWIARA